MENNEPITQVAVAATRLAKFIERVHSVDVENEMAKLPVCTECPLQKLTQVYLQELLEIESSFSPSVVVNSEFHITY